MKMIRGDTWRKSRLHDMRGNFAGLRDLPRAVVSAVIREGLGKYPALPWILSQAAKDNWRILEHGSGMSTVWWAQRVAHVHSIEYDGSWFTRVKRELELRNLHNVTLEHRTGEEYHDLSGLKDEAYDLIVIDGHARERVAAQASRLLKRPGWIYLDNTDFAEQWQEMYGEAEDILSALARQEGAEVKYFSGLAPGTFNTSQGMLLGFRERPSRASTNIPS
jgi:hypothetical protein